MATKRKKTIKLADSGKIGDPDINYLAPNGKWYTSEKSYLIMRKNVEAKDKCTDLMYEFMGYEIGVGMKISTFWFKKLKEWDFYGFDLIYHAMEMRTPEIMWAANNKTFKSESGKVQYICAIIENALNDALKDMRRKDTMARNIKSEETRDEEIASVDLDALGTSTTKSNVSNLLGDLQ